ncbi:unnamed protein product [Caenorhabditis brenneri]
MDGPSTSDAPQPKFVTPEVIDDEPGSSQASGIELGQQQAGEKAQDRVLNVDSEYEDDDCFEDGGLPPAPITRELVDGCIERRSKERQVKMSIGNYDDMEDDDQEETEEEKRARFAQALKNIRQNRQQEEFDLDPPESDAMRQFINNEVNSAMMFNRDNHIDDFDPLSTKKQPKVMEGYLWGAVIGNGSYGKVKEVIDVFTLTRRAIKIMKYDKLRKITNGWENIRCEMAILRTLNHKNVIRLIEVFNLTPKGKIYMVFEYCIGSVQQILDLEPGHFVTLGEAHAMFVDLCHGLNYLHSKRVSHKDIKPGNMLLSIDFTVKICDFGVAEQIGLYQVDGRCTKVNGTPKFQPPECVFGNHDDFDFNFSGYKADMWSAGVTLYNLVSGKYPFEKPVLLKLYESIGTDPLEMPTNVPISKELKDLLTKLLDKNYERRYSCLETLVHPWFISTFPEDQGLGRTMERMRTGNRPFTMFPSLPILFDEPTPEYLQDEDGNMTYLPPPLLVCGGELNRETFQGFKYLDDLKPSDEISGDRRPSSRSMPTAPPPGQAGSPPPPPVVIQQQNALQQDNPQQMVAQDDEIVAAPVDEGDRAPSGRGGKKKRSLFACIFRSRNDSN